jgi:histidine ammonia-lyase
MDHAGRLQDAYSFRCAPQVIGPAWDVLGFTQQCVERELNSATDNPLLFQEDLISGGNFHGEPIGLAADYLKLALSEVAAISERRVFRLTAEHTNQGLPAMLVADPSLAGIQSGLMILQYTAASIVLENQHIAQPDSIHSIPSSGDQEDHNANSTTAARNLRVLIENVSTVIAIELICAAQALDLRRQDHPGLKPGTGTSVIYQRIRDEVPFAKADQPFSDEIGRIAQLVKNGAFVGE